MYTPTYLPIYLSTYLPIYLSIYPCPRDCASERGPYKCRPHCSITMQADAMQLSDRSATTTRVSRSRSNEKSPVDTAFTPSRTHARGAPTSTREKIATENNNNKKQRIWDARNDDGRAHHAHA
eukprot:GHVU01195819.1.p2 GENE.GHVU01195819.1~~GHVU01195819.1.p2  ORF type:complete len:123 (-),score=3.56 GHVU01195819.1:213-581(-)